MVFKVVSRYLGILIFVRMKQCPHWANCPLRKYWKEISMGIPLISC